MITKIVLKFRKTGALKTKQDGSYQGEAVMFRLLFKVLWSSNDIKNLNAIKKMKFFFYLKFFKEKSSPHTPYKVQKDKFCSLQQIN